jgi:hypothetical protein
MPFVPIVKMGAKLLDKSKHFNTTWAEFGRKYKMSSNISVERAC